MEAIILDTERKIRHYESKLQSGNLSQADREKALLKICDLNALRDLYISIQAGYAQ